MKKIALILTTVLLCTAAGADNTKYVNMFMGTAGDHGQVAPAAQVPFGLASVCPDSTTPSHAGYDYDVPSISGISATRLSGVGGNGTGGNLSIRPARNGEPLEIVKGTEKAGPGFYGAGLSNGVKVLLTATKDIALERYLFPEGAEKVLYMDFDSAIDHRRSECGYSIIDANNIQGWVKTSTVCNAGVYKLYFHMRASEPFEVLQSDGTTALLGFAPGVKGVEVRIALSPIDEQTASEELALCTGTFKDVAKAAREAWRKVLSRVDVEGSTEEQKALFYTSMYRVFLSPIDATSPDGRYRGTDGQIHRTHHWTYYSEWSMWDTFRTKFPMLCLLAPHEMRDMCRSLVSLYQTGKKNWATMEECVPTVRTEHSQITLLDAWCKGIRGFRMADAFPGMEQEYEAGLVPGSKQGLTRNAPDQKMETVYDLWAMGQIAGWIGNDEARQKYAAESEKLFEQTWKKEFMTITDNFAQMKGNGMYQGTRWQYRWAMPLYAGRMIEWKGSGVLADELSEFFDRHLFNQGNEPDIHTPFMFNVFGHHERTDAIVHALLTDEKMVHIYGGNAEFPEPFVGRAFRNSLDGYAPEMDEDDGTMSAWYMFCQMGFYPLCVGTDRYELFTPLFEKVTLHLGGHDVVLRRKCAEASASRVVVDGEPLDGFSISHYQLVEAREIVFE